MTNPYAPPRVAVQDVIDPRARIVPADRGSRLGAAILDSLVFMAMVYGPMIVVGAMGAAATQDAESVDGIVIAAFAVALVGFAVWCWLTIRGLKQNGQSIAKKWLGIKVVRSDGSPVSLGRLIWLRNVVNWVISIIPIYGLVDALFIFGESRQCVHDKMADTIVIQA